MWKDPIVEEVRKNRIAIEKENKGDFSLLFTKAIAKYKVKQIEIKESTKNKLRRLSTLNA